MADFENIYLDFNPKRGKLRLASNGLGWKQNDGGDKPLTVAAGDMKYATWTRVARGFQLKLAYGKDKKASFDGFDKEDFDRLQNLLKNNYDVNVEVKETSLRGWNWGKAELQGSDLAFNIAGKPAFTIPVSSIHNSSINKQEVLLEFLPPEAPDESRKSSLGDQLMELRLYIPGSEATARKRAKIAQRKNEKEAAKEEDGVEVKKSESDEEEENFATDDEEGADQAAAEVFHDAIKERAELGQVQGDAIVTFSEVHCATPRGRYDIELYNGFVRIRNKSYDYKILFTSIKRLFILPRNDEITIQLVINVDPPLRQGQTRYSYLVLQFAREDIMEAELNLEEAEIKEKYPTLEEKYEDRSYAVVSSILKTVSGTKVVAPSKSFESSSGQHAVKCNMRANEGFLYFMDKYILFISKQPLLVAYNDVQVCRFERVAGAVASARTFDLRIEMRTESSDVTFSSINREEHQVISDFFAGKKLKVKNDIMEDMIGTQQAVAAALMDEASSDDESDNSAKPARKMDVDDEDSEVDEDFKAASESDVAEEFDENYTSSDSDEEAPKTKKTKATDQGQGPPTKKQKKSPSSDAEVVSD